MTVVEDWRRKEEEKEEKRIQDKRRSCREITGREEAENGKGGK